jgi:predicted DNA-binding protein
MMERTQIYLTREQREALRTIAERRDKAQSEIIREAIDRYIVDAVKEVNVEEVLEKTFGIWADRDDLDDLIDTLRREWDERIERWS